VTLMTVPQPHFGAGKHSLNRSTVSWVNRSNHMEHFHIGYP
jgi:hypothetical protein